MSAELETAVSNWVERIPIAETRNYVQRIMENLQMYGVRFGASVATREPNLHRAANDRAAPRADLGARNPDGVACARAGWSPTPQSYSA
jgi:hypothetical protein